MSRVFKYSHWCLSTRHHDSISELENVISVRARRRVQEEAGFDQSVDGAVEVLDSAVGEQGRLLVDQAVRGVEQELGRGARVERGQDFPCEDAAEIVDDGMEIPMPMTRRPPAKSARSENARSELREQILADFAALKVPPARRSVRRRPGSRRAGGAVAPRRSCTC